MPRPALQGVRVLVVEDEADARESISAALEQCGAQVQAVDSAAHAVFALERTVERPHVLLSDIGMPGTDGYQLLGQLRGRFPSEHSPAAALTAYASEEDQRQALAAGFEAHLAKPIDPGQLIATVAGLARGARGNAPSS